MSNKLREGWERTRQRGRVRFVGVNGLALAVVWIVVELGVRLVLGDGYLDAELASIIARAIFGGLFAAIIIWQLNEGRYRNSR